MKKALEEVFHHQNELEISFQKNIFKDLIESSKFIDVADKIKELFFKCRIHFRVRNLNNRLKIEKAKQKIMGYKKCYNNNFKISSPFCTLINKSNFNHFKYIYDKY